MIITLLTWLANTFIVGAIIASYQSLFGLVKVEWLYQLLAQLHMRVTVESTSFTLAGLLLLVVAILAQVPILHRLFMFLQGGRKPTSDEKKIIHLLADDLSQRTGIDMTKFDWYMKDDLDINAFAMGHNRICLNLGLFRECDYEEILGIIGHEMGHIYHRDSAYSFSRWAMQLTGQWIIRLYELSARIIAWLRVLPIPLLPLILWVFYMGVIIQIIIFQWIINAPLMLLDLFTGRRAEYRADAYACKIGLGRQLYSALRRIKSYTPPSQSSWTQSLYSTHPDIDKRLHRIQEQIV